MQIEPTLYRETARGKPSLLNRHTSKNQAGGQHGAYPYKRVRKGKF